MSRSDVALHEAGKTSFAPHSPVLAKDDEETHNHSGAAAAAVSQGDGHATHEESGDANKSCWSYFMCCFTTKKAVKAKDPAYEDKKSDFNQPNTKTQPKPAEAIPLQPAAPKVEDNSNNSANGNGSNAAAALAVQVSQDAPVPAVAAVPGYGYGGIRPPPAKCLLLPLTEAEKGKKTLVLDLDETLVHSSFKPIPNADFVISIELENVIHRVFVLKRPGVDAFLRAVGLKFEVVVFTASLAKYADPLLDILDRNKVVKTRLFREACVHHYGNYVKDLSHLGRRLEDTIIIDNSPFSYMFQPDNAIPITSWFNDKTDRQLYDLLPFLDQLTQVDDVCTLLHRRKQAQLAAGTNMA